ncbi:Protein CBG24149 [Caenorhabditis briggsae]|uniref:Protein CBG24149 n=1 Tax=Caenorhabditis briggsae TaxID=6238 RepID=A8WK30_CAEBR|nr:Protein CBG24149 [Caenorhabditis briggsae]CAP20823.1 Protein CBG24149 [Caenorhabditis briggsae]
MKVFIVSFVILTVALATEFDVSGSISCDSKKKWCYTVELLESDYLDNDYMNHSTKCVEPGTESYQESYHINGTQKDDGLWDYYFEIFVDFSHNCTGIQESFYHEVAIVPITEKYVT